MFGRKKITEPARTLRRALISSEIPVFPMLSTSQMFSEWEQTDSEKSDDAQNQPMSLNGMKPLFLLVFSDGRSMPIGTKCTIGRVAPNNDTEGDATFIAVPDPTQQISRRHFEIGVTPVGQVWVMDCGSLNGTWINSAGNVRQLPRMVRVRLYPEDVICFGDERAKLYQTWQ